MIQISGYRMFKVLFNVSQLRCDLLYLGMLSQSQMMIPFDVTKTC